MARAFGIGWIVQVSYCNQSTVTVAAAEAAAAAVYSYSISAESIVAMELVPSIGP